jgi:uncharacterized membrane protein
VCVSQVIGGECYHPRRSAMPARVSPSTGETIPSGADRTASGTARRIPALDLLRGFALLGMIVVHFHVRSTEPGGVDDVVRTAVWRLIEGKSFGAFALLFGAGFALQLRSAERQGRPFTGPYLRRLAVLAVFGAAAHALFGFNVLPATPCGASRCSCSAGGRRAR